MAVGDLVQQRHWVVRGHQDERRPGLEAVDDAVDRGMAHRVRDGAGVELGKGLVMAAATAG